MTIYLLSDSRAVAAWAKGPGAAKVKGGVFSLMPRDALKAALKEAAEGDLLYLDVEGLGEDEVKKAVKVLAKAEGLLWGLIDRKGEVEDPALCFAEGASDYLGKGLGVNAFLSARLAKVRAWRAAVPGADSPKTETLPAPGAKGAKGAKGGGAEKARAESAASLPPKGSFRWDKAVEGESYDFVFLYLQLDKHESLAESIGEARMKALEKAFAGSFADLVSPRGGIVWMWREACGLALLPYDRESGQIVVDLIRYYLDAPFRSAQQAALGMGFSFRTVLHVGSTVYQKAGNTGTIVSDSINSIFHLGQRYASDGDCLLTPEASALVPLSFADLFIPAGKFEGREIQRMRKLL